MRKTILLLLFCFITLLLSAQNDFRIVFYNVENLFDTENNPDTNDDDFLPTGNLRWTEERYRNKLNAIGTVIDSVGQDVHPALVGLCEVENAKVLSDLCETEVLKKYNYKYIVSESEDDRGMNVALLYCPKRMKVLSSREYMPEFEDAPSKHTRNILHVTGLLTNTDTLDLFICHFPSRTEGIKRTQPYRIQTAKLLKQKIDSLLSFRSASNMIIMGDFNDFPDDVSLRYMLEARNINAKGFPGSLYNMFLHRIGEKDFGTYKYRGKWQIMDQFIVSGNLLNGIGLTRIRGVSAYVYSAPFLFEDDARYGGRKPFRTYLGFKYLGGASDHLPIYMDIQMQDWSYFLMPLMLLGY